MVDAPAEAAGKAGEGPHRQERGAFAFAKLVLDLDACTLKRESGEDIALTRGEFALLREFVRRPGRVLSRDLLLDAMVGRRKTPFDRSVDVMVGRLRRKIEPEPKQPTVIQTVPGEGYRFTAPLSRRRRADAVAESHPQVAAETASVGARPVEPVRPDGAPPPPSIANAPIRSWRWLAIAAALVAVLFAAGAYGWRSPAAPRFTGTAAEGKPATTPRLSIIVLPFENMSGDKEQDYFADGITDDLTTDLSHLRDSFVIARGTAFTFKAKPVDAKEIGRELGVRYLLEGSVRRLGEKVEVNAQLISSETGAHVWADRFEGERSQLGELQVDAVSRLARSLGIELVKAEALRSMRDRPGNPDAVDLAMQAQVKREIQDSKATTNEAVTLAERALALDPQNVRALTVLADALLDRVTDQWSDDPAGDIARAEKTIDATLALQPENSSVHHAKGYLYFAKQQWGPAITEFETATALDPNDASAYADGGFSKMFVSRSEDGLAGVETALRLSPRDSSMLPWWQLYMCALQVDLSHNEQAIPWCNKAVAGLPQVHLPLLFLAAANALAGHDKEAKDAVAQLQKVYPGFTVQTWAGMHWSDDQGFNARY